MIATSYTYLCNRAECLNRVTGGLCVDESQVWLSAAKQGWLDGDVAYVHYCSQECKTADLVAARRAHPDRDIDDEVDAWHGGPDIGLQLHEFLDMTWDEYRVWAQHGTLPEGWAQREVSRVRP